MKHMRFSLNPTKWSQTQRTGFVLVVLAILLAAVGFYRNYAAEHDPTGAFWNAMTATMTTSGVTCTIHDVTDGRDSVQAVSLDLAGKERATSKTSITQSGTEVVTEGIATPDADYVRYTKLSTAKKAPDGKPLDFSKITGVWAKQTRDTSAASLFDQTALGGCVVPLADLRQNQGESLVADMRKNKVFDTKTSAAARADLHGQSVFKYKVTVTPSRYVPFMQRFAKAYGLQTLNNLSTKTFSDKARQHVVFVVSARQHRLLEITFDGQQHTIDFSNYGKPPAITLPSNPISFTELQKRLQGMQ